MASSGQESQSSVAKPANESAKEKRFANDGCPYTEEEFQEFFGMEWYKQRWNSAQVCDSVAKPVASDTVEPAAEKAEEKARLEEILQQTQIALAELEKKSSVCLLYTSDAADE